MRHLISLALAAALLAAPTAQAEVPSLDQIAVRDHALEWHGIRLRTTRRDVERQLKTRLSVAADDDVLACGAFKSSVALSGTTVVIQWSAADPSGRVDSLFFSLTPGEVARGLDALARTLLSRHAELELLSLRTAAPPAIDSALIAVRDHPDQVILIKGAPEHLVFISLDGCLD